MAETKIEQTQIDYVYRYGIQAGQDDWAWQEKGEWQWSHTSTEAEALGQIREESERRDVIPIIEDISIFRPQNREPIEPADLNATLADEPQRKPLQTALEPVDKQAQRVAEIATELADYASEQVQLPWVNAEFAIAENFRQQLLNGRTTIDLSQRYATDDPDLALARHEKALENLMPMIQDTQALTGFHVDRGTAIAHEIGQREVPAIQEGHGPSVGL